MTPPPSVSPYDAQIFGPGHCRPSARSASGGAVSSTPRRCGRRAGSKSGWRTIACVTVGKQGNAKVHPSASIARIASPASKWVVVRNVPPTCIVAMKRRSPAMWKSGSGSQNRSSSVSSQRSTTARAVRVSASWEMRQPLGSAVVPDVYISTPTSRIRVADAARRTTSGGTVSAAARNASRSTKPGGELSPSMTRRSGRPVSATAASRSGTKSTYSETTSVVSTAAASASRRTYASSWVL